MVSLRGWNINRQKTKSNNSEAMLTKEGNNAKEAAMRERVGDHGGGALEEDKGAGTIHEVGTPGGGCKGAGTIYEGGTPERDGKRARTPVKDRRNEIARMAGEAAQSGGEV